MTAAIAAPQATPAPADPASTARPEPTDHGDQPAGRTSSALARYLGGPIVDVLLGRRPLSQVRPRITRPVQNLLNAPSFRGLVREPGLRLCSLHACAITPDHVEGCAVIGSDLRTRAVVLRWERSPHGWLCTFLCTG